MIDVIAGHGVSEEREDKKVLNFFTLLYGQMFIKGVFHPFPMIGLESIIVLVASIVLIVKASDLIIKAGTNIAKELGVTEYLIGLDRKSTRLNSSHGYISYSLFFF